MDCLSWDQERRTGYNGKERLNLLVIVEEEKVNVLVIVGQSGYLDWF